MKSRYQILYNGHRYIIQYTETGEYHWGFVFWVPMSFPTPTANGMFRWKWRAKQEVRALEAYDREQAKKKVIENPNFKPLP